MDNLNELPTTPSRLDDSSKVYLSHMLFPNQNATDLRNQANQQYPETRQENNTAAKTPKQSIKTRLKRNYPLIIALCILYLLFSMQFIDMILNKKSFFVNQPARRGIAKVLLFSLVVVFLFMLPIST